MHATPTLLALARPRPRRPSRPRPTAPHPLWEGLFLEPVYTDGRLYGSEDEDTQFGDTES